MLVFREVNQHFDGEYIKWKPFLLHNFFIPYVSEAKESFFCSFSKLPCPSHLETPGQLPVLQVLEGTVDWVLWIFVISSFPTFSMSRNPFCAVLQSYHVRVTSKIQVNFRFCRNWRVLIIGSYVFRNFSIPNVFGVK